MEQKHNAQESMNQDKSIIELEWKYVTNLTSLNFVNI